MADAIKPEDVETGHYYGIQFIVPAEKSLRGKLIKIVSTDEGPLLILYGRGPWSVLASDIIAIEEVGPETRTPRSHE